MCSAVRKSKLYGLGYGFRFTLAKVLAIIQPVFTALKNKYIYSTCSFTIMSVSNSESYDQHRFYGAMFRGGHTNLFAVGGFFNKREYAGADCLDLLLFKRQFLVFEDIKKLLFYDNIQTSELHF